MKRIAMVTARDDYSVVLTLTDGRVIERNVRGLMQGPIFEPLLADPALFREPRVVAGTVVWPNGADLCPDVLIWGGLPPEDCVENQECQATAEARRG